MLHDANQNINRTIVIIKIGSFAFYSYHFPLIVWSFKIKGVFLHHGQGKGTFVTQILSLFSVFALIINYFLFNLQKNHKNKSCKYNL